MATGPTPDQLQLLADRGLISQDQVDFYANRGDPTSSTVPSDVAPPDQNDEQLARAESDPNGQLPKGPTDSRGNPLSADGIPTNSGINQVPPAAQYRGPGATPQGTLPDQTPPPPPAPSPELVTYGKPAADAAPTLTQEKPAPGKGSLLPSSNADSRYKAELGQLAGAQLDSNQKLAQAYDAGQQAQVAQSESVAANRQQAAAELMKSQADDQLRFQRAQERAQQLSDQSRNEIKQAMQQKVDPERWMHAEGPIRPILGVFGSALGAIAQSYGMKTNPYLDMVNREVERDVASQQQNIDNRLKFAQENGKLNEQDYQRAQDAATQAAKGRMDRYNAVIAQGDAIAAKYQSPQLAAQWAEKKAGLEQKSAEAAQQYATTVHALDKARENAAAAGQAKVVAAQADARKFFVEQKADFMKQGDDERTASARAMRLTADRFNLAGNFGKEDLPAPTKNAGKEGKVSPRIGMQLADMQTAIDSLEELKKTNGVVRAVTGQHGGNAVVADSARSALQRLGEQDTDWIGSNGSVFNYREKVEQQIRDLKQRKANLEEVAKRASSGSGAAEGDQ